MDIVVVTSTVLFPMAIVAYGLVLGVIATQPCGNGYARWVRAILCPTLAERNRAQPRARRRRSERRVLVTLAHLNER